VTRFGPPLFALALCALPGCGGKGSGPPPTVAKETAEAEVTRISHRWTSTQVDKALLSPPSPISVRAQTRVSEITFGQGSAEERLVIEEQFELRSGATIRCRTRFEHGLVVRFGRKSGDAAVELTRPALQAGRSCDGPPPEATLLEPERRALLVLQSDQLIAVEPALDERIYRPVSE